MSIPYTEYLQTVGRCPFCEPVEPPVEMGTYFRIVMARAPYADDHILIIPLRHVVSIVDLTPDELYELTFWQARYSRLLMGMGYAGITHLLRDGRAQGTVGKSIHHLHAHVIPDCAVAPVGVDDASRLFLAEHTFAERTTDLRHRIARHTDPTTR